MVLNPAMPFSLHSHSAENAIYEAASRRWWSYANLREAVSLAARHLEFPRKALLFHFCGSDIRSIVFWLAALESGHAVALLDDRLAPEAKAALLENYRPDFVSTASPAGAPGYAPAEGGLAPGLWCAENPGDTTLHPDLALLLSTSGTTGSSRFVRLTRRNVESNATSISQALAIAPGDCAIGSLPIHYSYGLSVLNTHLMQGASFALTPDGILEPGFWETFRTARCTSLAGVPYTYQILNRLGLDRLEIPTLNTLTQAGGRLQPDLIAKFSALMHQRGGRFFVMYGQTEATARISILPSHRLPEKLGSVGLPIPGGEVSILTEAGPAPSPGIEGELLYRGPNVMMGYAACREDLALGLTLEASTGGFLHTGDRASLDPEGYIFITGRAGRDAKLYGLRINLDEVEGLLRAHGPVAVISKGEKLRIYCEGGDPALFPAYQRDLAAKLRIHFDAFVFERIDRIPVTSSGKPDYPFLAALP